jgi:ABC-type sugar transport system permease subunit
VTAQTLVLDPVRAAARTRRRRLDSLYGFILVLPALVLVLGVIVIPVTYLVQTSFTNAHAYLPRRDFIGLANYELIFRSSSQFWSSLGITFAYTMLTLGLQLVLGVVVALALHQNFRGRGIVRMIAILPYMIPAVVVALVWRWLFDGTYGVYAQGLNAVLGHSADWLGSGMIFTTLVIVSVWLFTPFVTLSALARLQTIDTEMLEASHVDGAGAWRRFWSIIFPELLPVLLMLALLRFMFMFTKFDIVYLFANSAQSARTLPLLTFQQIFGESRLGAGSALAVFMCVLLIVITTIYNIIVSRRGRKKV